MKSTDNPNNFTPLSNEIGETPARSAVGVGAKKRPSQPPLLFGEDKAIRHMDARSLADQVQQIFPGLNAYDPLGSPTGFFAKSHAVALPSLKVITSVISPTVVDRDGKQEMTLLFPLLGQCQVTLDGKSFDWGAGRAGVFMPEFDGRVLGRGGERNLLMLNLERGSLESIARVMLGLSADEPVDLRLNEPRLTPTKIAGQKVELVLHHIGGIIELYNCNPKLLNQLGLEDILYRHVIAMLCPEFIHTWKETRVSRKVKHSATDVVCDAMRSALSRHWTLSELESLSGLSARGLQYAFRARFGCTPMYWLREQRLQLARRRLLLNDYETITQLAQDCGFTTSSQFASIYKSRFGVTPSRS